MSGARRGAEGGEAVTDAEICENEHCDAAARYACETDGLLLCAICAEGHDGCELDALAADMLP